MQAPTQQTIGMSSEATVDADIEQVPRQEMAMTSDPKHQAFWNRGDSGENHFKPGGTETLYSRCLCWSCSFGEVLGHVICGAQMQFFCCEQQNECGLSGKEGCLKCLGSGELWPSPAFECSEYCKCFPIKCGIDIPKTKPYLVFNRKTLA